MVREIISKLSGRLRLMLLKCGFESMRRSYWNFRAADIDRHWGKARNSEHERYIISKIAPQKLLDVGCGSGRIFWLCRDCGVSEIVAQDIAENAIKLCRRNYPYETIKYLVCPIMDIDYPPGYFDMTLCNRVLSAVPPQEIAAVVGHLARISKVIYIDEYSDSDFAGETSYWFKHDYDSLFTRSGFAMIETGMAARQTWKVFKAKAADNGE